MLCLHTQAFEVLDPLHHPMVLNNQCLTQIYLKPQDAINFQRHVSDQPNKLCICNSLKKNNEVISIHHEHHPWTNSGSGCTINNKNNASDIECPK